MCFGMSFPENQIENTRADYEFHMKIPDYISQFRYTYEQLGQNIDVVRCKMLGFIVYGQYCQAQAHLQLKVNGRSIKSGTSRAALPLTRDLALSSY